MKVYNNTDLTRETIEAMTVVGKIQSHWRQRNVTLYAPLGYLYTIGVAFNSSMMVIAKEDVGLNERVAIDYWAQGQKVLVIR